MQSIFVTGAEGFAGSYMIQYLRQRGYEVVAGVRNRARKLAFDRQHGKALVCDVSDAINVARAIASIRPDGVVHLGGPSRADEATGDPLAAFQNIVCGWANVLDGVRRSVPRARVLLVSAFDAYGAAAAGGQAMSEATPLQPTTTFGSLKAAAEQIARTFFHSYHLNVSVARPSTYTGAGQPNTTWFGAMAAKLARWDVNTQGAEFRVPDLECRRDVLHIDDVVCAYERLLRDGKPNEFYNVCAGQAVSCRELAEAMAATAGVSVRFVDQPMGKDEPRCETILGDNTRMRNELGWQPTRSATQAVQELVQSCRTRAAQPAAAGV